MQPVPPPRSPACPSWPACPCPSCSSCCPATPLEDLPMIMRRPAPTRIKQYHTTLLRHRPSRVLSNFHIFPSARVMKRQGPGLETASGSTPATKRHRSDDTLDAPNPIGQFVACRVPYPDPCRLSDPPSPFRVGKVVGVLADGFVTVRHYYSGHRHTGAR